LDDRLAKSMKEIFVCANYGYELSCVVAPDKYAGHADFNPSTRICGTRVQLRRSQAKHLLGPLSGTRLGFDRDGYRLALGT
jgi:hypothetical protein